MPFFGAFSPFPLRFGGGEGSNGKTRLQIVFESLAAQRGSAYDQTLNSAVGIENLAMARAITFDLYDASERLANNFRPSSMTAAGLLGPWEAIFDQPSLPGDTEPTRIEAAWAKVGLPNTHQPIIDALTRTLGPLFSGVVVYQTPGTATAFWPGASNATATLPWYSTINHISVQVTLGPAYRIAPGTPNGLFWSSVAAMVPVLDETLPSWVTFDWFFASTDATNDFLLDDPSNLDTELLT